MKRTLKYILFCVLTIVVISLGVSQTQWARDKVRETLAYRLSSLTGYEVKIEKLSGVFPFFVKIKNLSLNEYTVKKVRVSLDPLALLSGKIELKIHSDGIPYLPNAKLLLDSQDDGNRWRAVIRHPFFRGESLFELKDDGVIELCHMQIRSSHHVMTLHATLTPEFELLNSKFTACFPSLFDNLIAHGTVSGKLFTPHIKGKISGSKSTVKDLPFIHNIVGNFEADFSAYQAKAKAVLDLFLNDTPQHIECSFSTKDWKSKLLDLNISSSSSSFKGQLASTSSPSQLLFTNGEYENFHTGALFRNIETTLCLEKEAVTIYDFRADDGGSGELFGKGAISLDPKDAYPFSLILEAKNITPVRLDSLSGACDGQLKFSGSLLGGQLVGNLHVKKAEINLADDTPASPLFIDIEYSDSDNALQQKANLPSPPTFPLNLDIRVKSDKQILINGRGLKSKWEGELHLTQSFYNPLITGHLSLYKGHYLFANKRFTFREGVLTFNNQDFSLNLLAELPLDDTTIYTHLRGSLYSPTLSFSSQPTLPLNEILSRVLFNHGIQDISPLEALQLTQTLMDLQEGRASTDILGKIKKKVGVDQISIQNMGEENATLQVGKQLKNGAHLTLEKPLNKEEHRLCVKTHLTPKLRLQAEVSTNADNKMLLKWKRDY